MWVAAVQTETVTHGPQPRNAYTAWVPRPLPEGSCARVNRAPGGLDFDPNVSPPHDDATVANIRLFARFGETMLAGATRQLLTPGPAAASDGMEKDNEWAAVMSCRSGSAALADAEAYSRGRMCW